MEKRFEEIFRQRVHAVFEKYNDGSENEAWLLLREKFPEKKKKSIAGVWFVGGIAASLALLLGVGLMLYYTGKVDHSLKKDLSEIVYHSKKTYPSSKIAHSGKIVRSGKIDHSGELFHSGKVDHSGEIVRSGKIDHSGKIFQSGKIHHSVKIFQSDKIVHSDKIVRSDNIKQPGKITFPAPEKLAIKNHHADHSINSLEPAPTEESRNVDHSITEMTRIQPGIVADYPVQKIITQFKKINIDDPLLEITWNHLPDVKYTTVNKKNSTPSHAISMGVYADSYLSYAKGNQEKASLGGGISGAIRIARNLKVSAGLGLSPNNLSFTGSPESSGPKSNLSVIHTPNATKLYASSTFTNYTESSYNYAGYDASVLGMEVPINLIYEIPRRHYTAFLSAGLSSDALIKENYNLHYSATSNFTAGQGNSGYSVNNPGNAHSGTFNFARLLNLSFGIGYPLGKQTQLIIEPFLKYPLRPAGAQQISFGYGGLNLKMNFGGVNKEH